MKVSVVISACDNRLNMFSRSLDTWAKQTMPKEEFEIIVVDDKKREDVKNLCKSFSDKHGLQFQFIRIDNKKSVMPVKTFTPVISNNTGFRQAKGDVVVVTGPETLQAPRNVDIAYTMKGRTECAYGLVFRSNKQFVDTVENSWDKYKHFNDVLLISGAKADCRTRPPHPPAYLYLMAVSKEYVYKINGFDERYAAGLYAEDDDFANRMEMIRIQPVFEHKMVGIHQDHDEGDLKDPAHVLRKTPEGQRLRQKNVSLMKATLTSGTFVANVLNPNQHNYDPDYKWGDPRIITEHIHM